MQRCPYLRSQQVSSFATHVHHQVSVFWFWQTCECLPVGVKLMDTMDVKLCDYIRPHTKHINKVQTLSTVWWFFVWVVIHFWYHERIMVFNVICHHWFKNHGRSHWIIQNCVLVNSSWLISFEICECIFGFFWLYKYLCIEYFYKLRCHKNVFWMVGGPPKQCFFEDPTTGT